MERLVRCYHLCTQLQDREVMFSREIGERLGCSAAVVRKDFAKLGKLGTRGNGYRVTELKAALGRALGIGRARNAILIGAGSLGTALLSRNGFERQCFRFAAVFDVAPKKIGTACGSLVVKDVCEIPEVLGSLGAEIGVLAVPATEAQRAAELLVKNGIRAILNLTPAALSLGEGAAVSNVDFAVEMQKLAFFLSANSTGPSDQRHARITPLEARRSCGRFRPNAASAGDTGSGPDRQDRASPRRRRLKATPRIKRIRTLEDLLSAAKALRWKRVIAVAAAEDETVLRSIGDGVREGIIEPVLVGDQQKIKRLALSLRVSLKTARVVNEPDPVAACRVAVKMCREGEAHILMKGSVATEAIMHAVLDRDGGLSTERILSHAGVFSSPRVGRIMILSDAGVNVSPDVARKVDIIRNAVSMAVRLGISRPRVAMLAAVEKIRYPEMPATTDAAIITQMNETGQLEGAIVAGPYALDQAVSPHAAKCKGVRGPVAGRADILIAPDIESGNICYKTLVHFAGLEMASVVLGATVPVVVPSRSDSGPSKLYSIALGTILGG